MRITFYYTAAVHTGSDLGRQDRVLDYLLDEKLLRATDVEELRLAHGDDAATALLASDLLEEDTLLKALALELELPPARYRQGLFIERDLFHSVDAATIRDYEILPVRRGGQERIDLLVTDPLDDLAREILEDRFGLPLREYVWPRLRFLQALHFFLGDELPPWARRYLRQQPVTLGFASADSDIDVLKALRSSESLGVSQWKRNEVKRFIEDCFDRDTLLKVLLGYGAHWLANRLIVVIGKAGIQPYFIEDWQELEQQYNDVEALRAVKVETAAAKRLRDEKDWISGSAEDLELSPLFEALGLDDPQMLVVVPVQIGSRTAMTLVGVPADRQAAVRLDELSETFDGDDLQEVARWVGDQLEEMIRRAKTDSLPAPAERIPQLPHSPIRVGLGFEESLVEQKIARRGEQKGRHRWEIIDISEVAEESSIPEESSISEESADQSVVDAVAAALTSVAEELKPFPTNGNHDIPASISEVSLDPGATTFGMPAFQEISSQGWVNGDGPSSSATKEVQDDSAAESTADDGWSDVLSNVSELEGVAAATSSEILDSADGIISDGEAATTNPPIQAREISSGESLLKSSFESPPADPNAASRDHDAHHTPFPASPSEEETSTQEMSPPGANSQVFMGGLNIPSDASGVPRAQIFRRPRRKRNSPTSSSRGQARTDDDLDRPPITGRTILGLGEVSLRSDSDSPTAFDDSDDSSAPGRDVWINDLEDSSAAHQERLGGTITMNADAAKTQTFSELLEDMESENLPDPNTIPVEALESIPDTGPVAVEIEESLKLIDSADRDAAFAAAEHLAIAGPMAVERLKDHFPGRIFVDRYQYTVEKMPPVSVHGPLLEALVRIGAPSLKIVDQFIDDPSLECRFYATYLLTELEASPFLPSLLHRLFDKDQQTRNLAQNIVFTHRHDEAFEVEILEPLRQVIADGDDEFRLEIAADSLRRFKDIAAIPLLIEALPEQPRRVLDALHRALRELTFQSLTPAPLDWRQWWSRAEDQPRWRWLVDAMNSDDAPIRLLAFDEIEQLPGVDIDYHPEQPPKLRSRAQKELTKYFEQQV